MRRLMGLCAVITAIGTVAGCSQSTADCGQSVFAPMIQPTTTLLFDSQPSMVTAHDVRYDREWPNSKSIYRDPDHLYYQVYINDVQGAWPWGRDYTFRQFRLYQNGTATR